MPIDEYDEVRGRCPKMGDFVPFEFCRKAGKPFCWMIVTCWAQRIDIGQFLADNYEAEVIHEGLKKPAGGRLGAILDTSARYRTT